MALLASAAGAQSSRAPAPPPAGTKVISGRHFDIYVAKTESKPMGVEGMTLNVFQVVIVAKTLTHGTQRIARRTTSMNGDLLNPASWKVEDFDGDGYDDYIVLMQVNKNGCQTWDAERWQPDRDHFMFATKYNFWIDAKGKKRSKSCNL